VTALSGIIPALDEQTYHAHPALSSTGARLLLDSPARFKYRMAHPYTSDAFDLGTAVHTKVLGVGHKVITYPPEHLTPSGNPSTKAATVAWVEEQRAKGLALVPQSQVRAVEAMTESVLAHPTARAVLEREGIREASVFGTDPATGVDMRARFDHLQTGGNRTVAVDLKTTPGSASSAGFGKSAATYGYHIQEAHYLNTLQYATGNSDAQMVFVVVEKEPPYFVAVHQLDDQFALIGQDEARRARDIYARCLDTDEWPAYPAHIIQTSPPAWLVYKHQDQYEQEIEVA
jgi:hypothetical protein